MTALTNTKEFSKFSTEVNKNELKWFKHDTGMIEHKSKLEDLTISHKNKTKIIVSLKKGIYTKETFNRFYQQGVRSFRIDGSQINQKDYSKLINNLQEVYHKEEEIPCVIFDLKGPMPMITHLGSHNLTKKMNVTKGQQIKILYDHLTKNHEDGIVYIDKKISNGLNIGDLIVFSQSDVKLKVQGFEKIKGRNKNLPLINNDNIYYSNSSPVLLNSIFNFPINPIKDKENLRNSPNKKEKKRKIKEYDNNYFYEELEDENTLKFNNHNLEDEELLIDATQFDNFYEEKLKNKFQKTTQVYNNFIKRHASSNNNHNSQTDYKIINEMDKLSCISYSNANYSIISESVTSIITSRKTKIRKKSSCSNGDNTNNNVITCEVIQEGAIQPNKIISTLYKDIIEECEIPMIGAKDIIDLNKAYSMGINIFSVLVNNADILDEIKDILGEEAKDKIKLFARIETQNAIMNFDSILLKADGIIIHHGLITSSLEFDELNLVEIYMIEKCKLQNKPIILQNYSLKSININKPLISKISTLDFAVKEGIDSIILEEEINSENCFLDTIQACRDVLLQIEAFEDSRVKYEEMSKFFAINKIKDNNYCDYLFDCAAKLSYEIKADLIILFTDKCSFAQSLTNYRPACLVVYPSVNKAESEYVRLFRGVVTFFYKESDCNINLNTNMSKPVGLIKYLLASLKTKNVIRNDIDKIIIVNAYYNSSFKYRNSFFIIDQNMLE